MIKNKIVLVILLFTLKIQSSELQTNMPQQVQTVTSTICKFFGFNQQKAIKFLDPKFIKETRTQIHRLKPSRKFTLAKRFFVIWCMIVIALQKIVLAKSFHPCDNQSFLRSDQCMKLDNYLNFKIFWPEVGCKKFSVCKLDTDPDYKDIWKEYECKCKALEPENNKTDCFFSCERLFFCNKEKELCKTENTYHFINQYSNNSYSPEITMSVSKSCIFCLFLTLVTLKLVFFDAIFN